MMRVLWQHLSRFTFSNVKSSANYFSYLALVPNVTKPIGLLRVAAADLSQLRQECENLKQEPFGKKHVDVNMALKCIMLDLPKVIARHNHHIHAISDEIFRTQQHITAVEKRLAQEMRDCLCEVKPEEKMLESLSELQNEINTLRERREQLEDELAASIYHAPLEEQVDALFERAQDMYCRYFGYLEPPTPAGQQIHHAFMYEPLSRISNVWAVAESEIL